MTADVVSCFEEDCTAKNKGTTLMNHRYILYNVQTESFLKNRIPMQA